jgi:PAS domain S-box-containing protein
MEVISIRCKLRNMISLWIGLLQSSLGSDGVLSTGAAVTTDVGGAAVVPLWCVLALGGLVGMAVRGDADDPITRLTEKVRRAAAGEADVDFTTDRDDEIGALYDAVGDLVASSDRETKRDEAYRKRLYDVASDSELDSEETVQRLLELGCERLEIQTGLVTRIDGGGDRYEIEHAVGEMASAGTVLNLSDTFCRRTITADGVLGIYDSGEVTEDGSADLAESGVGCYIGSKLVVDGDLYGTLCFMHPEPRERPFSHAEKVFVDLMGRWISQEIERRERIEELEEHASMLDSLFEQLPVSLYVKDAEGRHIRKSTPDRGGPRPDDDEWYAGKTDLELYPEEYSRETYEDDMSVIESGEPIIRKIEHDARADEWLVTSKVPWLDDDGETRGLIGVSQYITEQKQHERKLEAIVENTGNQIYIKDEDGVYQFANDAAAEVFGRDPEDVVGMIDEELFDTETACQVAAQDRYIMETGETVTSETITEIDGQRRVFLNDKYPYRDEDGEIIGVMGISKDITERKERERKLRERERELSTLMENVPGMVYRCANEPDWPFEFVSEGCRELTGYEPSAIRQGEVGWNDEVIVGDTQELWDAVQRAVDNGERFQVTYQAETVDGERRWFWEQGTPVYDETGTVEALEGVIMDVTARRERERELQATNERLNTLIEASPDALVAIDPDGTVELWNPAAERMFGWTEDEVLGGELPFVPEDRTAEFEKFFERLLDGESISGVETQRLCKDGSLLDVSVSVAPFYGPDGTVTGIMSVMEDIGDRKDKERQLRERERELDRYREFTEDILDAVDDVFYVLDEDGYLERWNDTHVQMTGYSDEEIASMHATDFFAPEDRAAIEAAIEEVHESGQVVVEAPYLTKDGEQILHEFVAVEIEDPDGNPVIAGIGRDISERKRRERELERTTDLLSRAEEMADIGGWSMAIEEGVPADNRWTDKLYDVMGVPDADEPPMEEIFEFYHPDDRERHREALDRAIDLGVGWDQELQLTTPDGVQRWVRNIGEPVVVDDETVEVRGSVQDITEPMERQLALESLHDSTRGLLTTETTEDAAALIVDTAASILDYQAIGIYRYDETTNRLEPSATTEAFERYCGGEPAPVGPGTESFVWHSYVTGTLALIDDVETSAGTGPFVESVGNGIVVPIGDYGVFVAVDDAGAVGESDRYLAETLVATAEAAFDRIQSEAALRDREAEIEAQNERLRRQIRANETIRSVDRSLIGATDRDQLEADVCDRLVDGADVSFAWIGAFDESGERLRANAWAGAGESYLDSASFERSAPAREPAVRAAIEDEPVVVENIAQNVQREEWRQAALAAGFQSVLAVPIALDDYHYGVLAVYADEPSVFEEFETTVFAELGESIANAITSITTRQALNSDTLTALELRVEDATEPLVDIASGTGCTVEYEGLATVSSDETRLFVRTGGCDPSTVSDLFAERHTVRDHHLVNETEDGAVFEVTLQGETIVSRLVRGGGRIREITADASGLDVAVDVPVTTDVRSFVDRLTDDGSVELISRQERTRSLQSKQDLVDTILDGLTDRQREVLRTGYFSGFFNWPRDTTGQELATMLDVSQPTVNRHLRLGQQRVMRQLFDADVVSD